MRHLPEIITPSDGTVTDAMDELESQLVKLRISAVQAYDKAADAATKYELEKHLCGRYREALLRIARDAPCPHQPAHDVSQGRACLVQVATEALSLHRAHRKA